VAGGGHVTLPSVIGELLVVGRGLVGEQLIGEIKVATGLGGYLIGEDGCVDQLLSDAHSLDFGILALLLGGGRRRRGVVSAAERDDVLV
jgi:hypothetical protein